MDDLRARGLISIVGPESESTPAAVPASAPAATAQFLVYASRTEDPAWYAAEAAELLAQLETRAAALAQAQTNLAEARALRGATGSFNMAATDDAGVTLEEHIAILDAQTRETQSRLDELADLARRNDIAPGVLRTAAV